jgi:hypothetical protein
MANTYNWKINQLDAKIQQDGLDNVIYTVHWSYIAEDDSEPKIVANCIGSEYFKYIDGEPFTPYNELTKDDVVGWLESKIDINIMKENLDKQIESIKNPTDEFLKPDWN